MRLACFIGRCAIALATGSLIAGCAGFGASSPFPAAFNPEHPECPHDWTFLPAAPEGKRPEIAVSNMTFPSGFSVSGAQTNVPEFNDCQKIMLKSSATGEFVYGPLM